MSFTTLDKISEQRRIQEAAVREQTMLEQEQEAAKIKFKAESEQRRARAVAANKRAQAANAEIGKILNDGVAHSFDLTTIAAPPAAVVAGAIVGAAGATPVIVQPHDSDDNGDDDQEDEQDNDDDGEASVKVRKSVRCRLRAAQEKDQDSDDQDDQNDDDGGLKTSSKGPNNASVQRLLAMMVRKRGGPIVCQRRAEPLRRMRLMQFNAADMSEEESKIFIRQNFAELREGPKKEAFAPQLFELALHCRRLRTVFMVTVEQLIDVVRPSVAVKDATIRYFFTALWRLSLDGMIDSGRDDDDSFERRLRSGQWHLPMWVTVERAFAKQEPEAKRRRH